MLIQTRCSCTEIYDPFCGSDGADYNNACFAFCAGADLECRGICPCPPPSQRRTVDSHPVKLSLW